MYAQRFSMPLFIRAGERSFEKQGVIKKAMHQFNWVIAGFQVVRKIFLYQRFVPYFEDINIQIHISHISTRQGVLRIQQAKRRPTE